MISDRNECLEFGFCEQLCTNTNGGYVCNCASGYTRYSKSRCRVTDAEPLELLVAQERAIWRVLPSSGNDERHILANTTGASGLDFHYERNLLFWSDVKTRKIHSQSLKGIPVQHTNYILIRIKSSYSVNYRIHQSMT